jgi:catechol 2,3-dioxygenase-like lactoylglutathione lyase family enzyme
MIHHVSLGTNDLDRARTFYDAVMGVLGWRLMSADERMLNYGVGDIMLSVQRPANGAPAHPGNGVHVAFPARDRGMVKAFYEAALANGGTDEGQPGLRTEYNPNYFAAFVLDPDGNKIEAVTLNGE